MTDRVEIVPATWSTPIRKLLPWVTHKRLNRADGSTYLERWHILPRNPVLNVYLYKFVGDDDDRCPHDHPWHSLSILLRGAYWEAIGRDPESAHREMRRAPAVIYRRPTDAHRIMLPTRERRPAWSLFITGPKVREWGFWHARDIWHRHYNRPPEGRTADMEADDVRVLESGDLSAAISKTARAPSQRVVGREAWIYFGSDALLTTREAAQALGMPRSTLQDYVSRGQLEPAVRGEKGNKLRPHRFRVADLEKLERAKRGRRQAAA